MWACTSAAPTSAASWPERIYTRQTFVRRGSSLEQEVEHHVAERAYKDDSAGYPIKLRQSRLGQSSNVNLDLLSSELTNYIRRSLAGILICRVIVNPVKDLDVSQFLVEVC